jgi:hypothetical protein
LPSVSLRQGLGIDAVVWLALRAVPGVPNLYQQVHPGKYTSDVHTDAIPVLAAVVDDARGRDLR